MGLLSGAARVMGGVLVEIDDPALSFKDAATRTHAVFEQRLGAIWPEAVAKLEYSLSSKQVGQTRFIAVFGLGVASDIAIQMCSGKGNQAFIDMLDRVAGAAEQLLRRPPEASDDDDQEMEPPPGPVPDGRHLAPSDHEMAIPTVGQDQTPTEEVFR